MRMTTVIRASVPVATRDLRCTVDGARSLATSSVSPMGVTRMAGSAGRGGAWKATGANIVRCSTPRLRYQFSSNRDRTWMAALRTLVTLSRHSWSSTPAATRIRAVRRTFHCARSAAPNSDMPSRNLASIPPMASTRRISGDQ